MEGSVRERRVAAAAVGAALCCLGTFTAVPATAVTAVTAVPATAVSTVAAAAGPAVPRPDHTVVVVMENHSFTDVIGDTAHAPYINSLAAQGASLTDSHGIGHPSEPNYLALFSGSTQGLTDDSCPHSFAADNLGSELQAAGFGFAGYSESMPSQGYTGCTSGAYARKHNPWSDFGNVPAADNKTFGQFPTDYSTLPTVSFVVPNLDHDMHDGTVAQGDAWLRSNLDGYVQWAKAHNSLLVLTWDEDDDTAANRIPTVFVGAAVKPGSYAEQVDHYGVLRTLEDAYGLAAAGGSASSVPVTDIWTADGTGSATASPGPSDGTAAATAATLSVAPGAYNPAP